MELMMHKLQSCFKVALSCALVFSLNVFNKSVIFADETETDDVSLQAGTYDESSVVVKFKDGVDVAGDVLDSKDTVKNLSTSPVQAVDENTAKVEVADDKNVKQAISELSQDSRVEYVEPNYVATLFDVDSSLQTTTINDPYQSRQWYLNDKNANVKEAWDTVRCNGGVTVAVLDSGIDTDHPDLVNNYVGGRAFVGNDATNIEDTFGHGTMVSGIIAAQSNNAIGISGISYNAKIFSLKAFEGQLGSSVTMAAAIEWMVANNDQYGVRIINISAGLSPGTESKVLSDAVTRAYNAGILCVCASGNNSNTQSICQPASMGITLAVGSIDSSHTRASSSNGGAALDVVAPGVETYSTSLNGGYDTNSGTSFATPFVSAVAALCVAKNSDLTPTTIKGCITSTAKDLGDVGKDNLYGYGQVVVSDAVKKTTLSSMYRLYNKWTGEHFYTADFSEKNKLVLRGWADEGIGWWAPTSSSTPVYRLYNKYEGDHHFTTSKSEYVLLGTLGWNKEGVGWQSASSTDSSAKTVWRQYNPNARVGTHNFTTSTSERDKLVSLGWKNEGEAWWGL